MNHKTVVNIHDKNGYCVKLYLDPKYFLEIFSKKHLLFNKKQLHYAELPPESAMGYRLRCPAVGRFCFARY